MPTSVTAVTTRALHRVWLAHRAARRPLSVLDVGPGFGKTGLLLRETVEGINRGAIFSRLDAIEAEPDYPDRFPWLHTIYDTVYEGDIRHVGLTEGLTANRGLASYDVVLMLEVLEHLDDAAGEAVLARIPGQLIITTPRDWLPQRVTGYPFETHRSQWSAERIIAAAGDRPGEPWQDLEALDTLGAVIVDLPPQRA